MRIVFARSRPSSSVSGVVAAEFRKFRVVTQLESGVPQLEMCEFVPPRHPADLRDAPGRQTEPEGPGDRSNSLRPLPPTWHCVLGSRGRPAPPKSTMTEALKARPLRPPTRRLQGGECRKPVPSGTPQPKPLSCFSRGPRDGLRGWILAQPALRDCEPGRSREVSGHEGCGLPRHLLLLLLFL